MNVSIRTVNVATITQAVVDQLKRYPALAEDVIERSEEQRQSVDGERRVGVYRIGVRYQQRVLGYGGGVQDQRVQLLILASASNLSGGAACEDTLEELTQDVVSALLSDTSLGGLVRMIEDIDITYPSYDKVGSTYTQTAAIQFAAVGNTTASQA